MFNKDLYYDLHIKCIHIELKSILLPTTGISEVMTSQILLTPHGYNFSVRVSLQLLKLLYNCEDHFHLYLLFCSLSYYSFVSAIFHAHQAF